MRLLTRKPCCEYLLVLTLGSWVAGPARAAEPPVTALAFAPDGEAIVAGSQAGLHCLDWPTCETRRTLDTHLSQIHDVAFSPNGKYLAAAGGTPAESGIVEMFRWPDGACLFRQRAHADVIQAVAWRSDSAGFATASLDRYGRVFAFDPERGALVTPAGKSTDDFGLRVEGHSRGLLATCFLPADHALVTAGIDQSIRVWNVRETKALPVRTLENHTRAVVGMAVRPSPGGSLPVVVSAGKDRTIRLWQPTIGRLMRFARLPKAVPLAVAWAARGTRIVVACDDGHVRVIDPDSVQVIDDRVLLDGWAYSLAVHPDGKQIAVGGSQGFIGGIRLE